jgi:hypothetical protein
VRRQIQRKRERGGEKREREREERGERRERAEK